MKVFTSVKNEGMLSIHTPHNFNATCDEAVIPQQMTKHARKHTHTHSHTHKSSHQFRWYGWEEPAALMLVLMVLGILPMPVGKKMAIISWRVFPIWQKKKKKVKICHIHAIIFRKNMLSNYAYIHNPPPHIQRITLICFFYSNACTPKSNSLHSHGHTPIYHRHLSYYICITVCGSLQT